jgi:hypothetical protein
MNVIHLASTLALAVVLAATHWKAYHTGASTVQVRWDAEKTQLAQQAFRLSEHFRAREQAAVQAKSEVEKRYVDLKARNEVAAAGALRELERLRHALASPAPSGNTPSEDSAALARFNDAASVERKLLGECASALAAMGGTAGSLAAQVIGLQDYVSQVCKPQP